MVDEVYPSLSGLFPGGDHDVLDTSLWGHRRLLNKFCILSSLCYESNFPGCKRRNAGLKSPNTPTYLEVLRNGGAKVNAELAATIVCVQLVFNLLLPTTIQFTKQPAPIWIRHLIAQPKDNSKGIYSICVPTV